MRILGGFYLPLQAVRSDREGAVGITTLLPWIVYPLEKIFGKQKGWEQALGEGVHV